MRRKPPEPPVLPPSPESITVPWTSAAEGGGALSKVVNEIGEALWEAKTAPSPLLTQKQKDELEQRFKHAEQARTPIYKFMKALANYMGLDDDAIVIAPMKSWERAGAKMNAPGRNLHDLGRGRILLTSPAQIQKFYKFMAGCDDEGYFEGFTKKARMKEGTFDDYLKSQRKSGYAGSINFDVEVILGKNRKELLEVQIMPRDYKETYDRSHLLYDSIRILEETREGFRSDDHKYVLENLVLANAALFDEYAYRTGFDKVRAEPIKPITHKQWLDSLDVLDRVRTAIEKTCGVKLEKLEKSGKETPEKIAELQKWYKDTLDAFSYAKTSVSNLYAAAARKKGADPAPDDYS